MTIGSLSRRTGVPAKLLRQFEVVGFIYTAGRSPGNYRLFDEEALWCVVVMRSLRAIGRTLAEIQDLTTSYLSQADSPIGPKLAQVLEAVRKRTEMQIAELRLRLQRIAEFAERYSDELRGRADFRSRDPRDAGASVDSPPGERL
ncbi:MAG TPA: MerR family transcriptional regulator [Candidatus Dormibacteraeota bacterium]|nr:MerR family transcriptional regulator [Candidatus Dormibacteraeota bacterium]